MDAALAPNDFDYVVAAVVASNDFDYVAAAADAEGLKDQIVVW